MPQLSLETHKEHDGWEDSCCAWLLGSISPFLEDTDETATLKRGSGNHPDKPRPLFCFSLSFVELACSRNNLHSLGKYQPDLLKIWHRGL